MANGFNQHFSSFLQSYIYNISNFMPETKKKYSLCTLARPLRCYWWEHKFRGAPWRYQEVPNKPERMHSHNFNCLLVHTKKILSIFLTKCTDKIIYLVIHNRSKQSDNPSALE